LRSAELGGLGILGASLIIAAYREFCDLAIGAGAELLCIGVKISICFELAIKKGSEP
jgi:hypothetical protein